jgi:hypothetical protein
MTLFHDNVLSVDVIAACLSAVAYDLWDQDIVAVFDLLDILTKSL